jgi:hypothetical protein
MGVGRGAATEEAGPAAAEAAGPEGMGLMRHMRQGVVKRSDGQRAHRARDGGCCVQCVLENWRIGEERGAEKREQFVQIAVRRPVFEVLDHANATCTDGLALTIQTQIGGEQYATHGGAQRVLRAGINAQGVCAARIEHQFALQYEAAVD